MARARHLGSLVTQATPLRSVVALFGNVTFGVTLLAIWGVLTIVGVIVEQGQPGASYFASYPAPIARAILRMNFDDVYHSVWYLASIGFVLASMMTATFTKVIPRRLPPRRAVKVDAIPLHAHVRVEGDEASVRARVEAFFARRGWTIAKRDIEGTHWTFADRFNWARIGVLVNHFAILVIAAGAVLYWARGYAGQTIVLTGNTAQIPQNHDLVRLDGFSYKISPVMTKSGIVYQPIDYISHVTVVRHDGIPTPMIVRVNHPIDLDGTLFYQASYGFGMRFYVTHDGRPVPALSEHTYMEGDTLQIPGTSKSVVYERFVPTVDRRTRLPSPDPRVNDPAVVLAFAQDGAAVGSVLAPLRSPLDLGGGWRIVPRRYTIYSGFQYRYDPGVPLVAAGAALLLIGLVISFYFLPARLAVRVDSAEEGACTVGLAATTVKGYDIFENAFRELVAALGDDVRRRQET
ncbi:MAG: cytochrome c biogenesis protein ResB [Candidatus Tyrphobacter sp.]